VNAGQIISNDLYVRMLKNIIYSGDASVNKFLLTGFPLDDSAVAEFE
jgi:adenylate kinase family enzyme